MARNPALVNQLADQLLAALRRIDSTLDAGNWLTSPRSFGRGFYVGDLGALLPALQVRVRQLTDAPLTGSIHRGSLALQVFCLTTGDSRGEVEMQDLVSDVFKAVTDDEDLGGLAITAYPEQYQYNGPASESAGLTVGIVDVAVEYEWSHGQP